MTLEEMKSLRDAINVAEDIEAAAERWGMERDKSGRGWKCPEPGCASGNGNHGTGPTRIPGSNKLRGFGCGHVLDVIEIIQTTQNVSHNEALRIGAEMYGLSLDGTSFTGNQIPAPCAECKSARTPDGSAFDSVIDFPATLGLETLNHPTAAAYLERRQIPADVASRIGIRYDAPRNSIIVPTGGNSYAYRPMYAKTPGEKIKTLFVSKERGGRVLPFNANALRGTGPVAIVEGWENAASFEAVGCPAVAIHGATLIGKLLSILDWMHSSGEVIPALILALDADDAGRKATHKLSAALDDRGIRYTDAGPTLYGEPLPHEKGTDPNDLLCADRDAFARAIQCVIRRTKDVCVTIQDGSAAYAIPADAATAQREAEQAERRAMMRELTHTSLAKNYRTTFQAHIDSGYGTPISTGYKNIDSVLGGGFRPGLFVLGAGTGIGKTSLALSIADNIAQAQHPVLYVSMEMSRDELIGKSISRIARALAEDDRGIEYPGLNAILEGRGGPYALTAQAKYFDTIAPWMHQIEGVGDQTADDVRAMAEAVTEARGTAPVVVIDYVQILASPDVHLSDKQAVDRNTYALKRLSRDLNVPVLAISTMNRTSYGFNQCTPNADMLGALKESGALEYTGDAAIILYRLGYETHDGGERMEARIVKGRRIPPRADFLRFISYGGSSYFADAGTTPYREITKSQWPPIGCDFEEYTGDMPDGWNS